MEDRNEGRISDILTVSNHEARMRVKNAALVRAQQKKRVNKLLRKRFKSDSNFWRGEKRGFKAYRKGLKRKLIKYSIQMQNCPTPAEKKTMESLKSIGVEFRQQYVVGARIIDFYLPQYKIAVEVDGMQHYTNKGKESDADRSAELGQIIPDIRFIRLRNDFVMGCKNLPECLINLICRLTGEDLIK